MAKHTTEMLEFVAQARAAGSSWPEAFEACTAEYGSAPSYGPAWLYCERLSMDPKDHIDPTGVAITEARNAGDSWGRISVRANLPESRVRRLFEETSGVRSQGLRNGNGGRFFRSEPAFYQGEAHRTGTAFPVGAKVPNVNLMEQREALVAASTISELRKAAKAQGLSGAGTKADIAARLITEEVATA
jgi:hypothetical protein